MSEVWDLVVGSAGVVFLSSEGFASAFSAAGDGDAQSQPIVEIFALS
jgi:hypothetical protein